MFWRARSTRFSADFPPDGEAALRPLPGLSGVELAGAGLGGSGLGAGLAKAGSGKTAAGKSEFGNSWLAKSGAALFSDRAGGDRPGHGPSGAAKAVSASILGQETPHESAQRPQPSGPDGVREDMATLVLDNSAMGAGTAARLEARPDDAVLNAALDPASDAAVMLRVAAGDEAGFNFLVGK